MEKAIYGYREGENIITAYQEYQYDMVPGLRTWKGQCQYKRKPRKQTISISRFFPDHRGKAYITEWNQKTKIATFEGSGPLLYKGVEVGEERLTEKERNLLNTVSELSKHAAKAHEKQVRDLFINDPPE